MESITRIATPVSESWTAWILLSLMVCLILISQRQTGIIRSTIHGLFTAAERTYNDGFDLVQYVLMMYYRIATPTIALYILFSNRGDTGVRLWLWIMFLWVAADCVKWICAKVVQYTFELDKGFPFALRSYNEIWLVANTILLPVAVIMMHWGVSLWTQILLIITLFITWGLMLIKAFRLFVNKPIAIVYVLMYFVTCEIIPMVAIYEIVWRIIRY